MNTEIFSLQKQLAKYTSRRMKRNNFRHEVEPRKTIGR